LIWAVTKRQIQYLAGMTGHRIVPTERDAWSLKHWLDKQPIRTVIDVGASRGEISEEWLKRYPRATVHSIEPLPNAFGDLKKKAALSKGRLYAYNYAIGRSQGRAEFRVHTLHDTSSSLLTRTEHSSRILPGTREETSIEVDVTTLDDLFAASVAAMTREILLKLDVQGVESDVIAGGPAVLRHVKYFLTEVTLEPVYVGQSKFNDIHKLLTDSGFALKGFLEQYHTQDLTPIYADVLYVNEAI
jgi:FkbM family methyltransferase